MVESYIKPEQIERFIEVGKNKIELYLKNGFKILTTKDLFENYEQFRTAVSEHTVISHRP